MFVSRKKLYFKCFFYILTTIFYLLSLYIKYLRKLRSFAENSLYVITFKRLFIVTIKLVKKYYSLNKKILHIKYNKKNILI